MHDSASASAYAYLVFVPAYWNPPTLLDLARRTGFDLESLPFSFAIWAKMLVSGGLLLLLYFVG